MGDAEFWIPRWGTLKSGYPGGGTLKSGYPDGETLNSGYPGWGTLKFGYPGGGDQWTNMLHVCAYLPSGVRSCTPDDVKEYLK